MPPVFLRRPPTPPDVALPKTASLGLSDKLLALAAGIAGVPATDPNDFATPDVYRQADRWQAAGEALSMLGVPLGILGMMKLANPVKAFHGSPHDFEAFDLSKIGTGEGAQAYGYGLYFAEDPTVARTYRGKVSALQGQRAEISGRPINWDDPIENAAFEAARHGGDREAAAKFHEQTFAKNSPVPHILRSDTPLPDVKFPGRTYEVNLHASPDEFLDWDKPLSQQSEKVQQAIKRTAVYQDRLKGYKAGYVQNPDESSGSQWISFLQNEGDLRAAGSPSGPMDAASSRRTLTGGAQPTDKYRSEDVLSQAGIKGIRYLDQGSRDIPEWRVLFNNGHVPVNHSTKEQAEQFLREWSNKGAVSIEHVPKTSNYVVFDDKIIEIAKKYGVALPIAAEILRRQQHESYVAPETQ